MIKILHSTFIAQTPSQLLSSIMTLSPVPAKVEEKTVSGQLFIYIHEANLEQSVGVRDLRDAIPSHCFHPSYLTSFSYLARDLLGVAALAVIGIVYIPLIENPYYRMLAWTLYGVTQGLFGTGVWVLAHECGHGGFSPSQRVNDSVGWVLHSALLTPYFSWKSTHRRHHMYANHMEKDHHYVPLTRDTYAAKLGIDMKELDDLSEDAPFVTLVRIVI